MLDVFKSTESTVSNLSNDGEKNLRILEAEIYFNKRTPISSQAEF